MTEREQQLVEWLAGRPALSDYVLTLASGDASFRRYFRVTQADESYIVMDAPPEKEDCSTYLDVTTRLQACDVSVPAVIDQDLEQGFLLLSDLGSTHYLDKLTEDTADELYGAALVALAKIQQHANTVSLPAYDETLLLREMQLFKDWLLQRHLDISLSTSEKDDLKQIFNLLIDNASMQPQVFVHRDYHSRNLMVMAANNRSTTPGILDFQDAVRGPWSYDLASLLKDCYIKWPYQQVEKWALGFYQTINPGPADNKDFMRQFDLMGVQRHLKASGIFARLYHRDGKPGYLQDIARTLSYITDLSADYEELGPLIKLIEQRVMPNLEEVNLRCMP